MLRTTRSLLKAIHPSRSIKVQPFRGFLPDPALAKSLISPPYDVLNSEEARDMAEGNPVSFLHVNKPEIDLPTDTDPYSDIVYRTGRKNLEKFIAKDWLQQDPKPRVYIYSIEVQGKQQVGIVAGASVDDYTDGTIKRHEFTTKPKEKDRTRLTIEQGANVGPVFMTYRATEEVNSLVAEVMEGKAYVDVVTEDEVGHTLWKCSEEETNRLTTLFQDIPEAYIADGHHRSASAYNTGIHHRDQALQAGKEVTGQEDFNYFLSIFYPDTQLEILDYNRVLKTLNNRGKEEILDMIRENFTLEETDVPRPAKKGHFSLYMDGAWYRLKLNPGVITATDPVSTLDSQVLTDLILNPIFGIKDLRSDDRIDYIGGARGLKEIERRCEEDCVCGFALYPIQIGEVMEIADAGLIMPPKSTWFEPKPRSGMVVRVFDRD